jgi:hypothetical protein
MNNIRFQKIAVFVALVALMASTRTHHFDSMTHLPDASLAVFLLAGFLLPTAAFPLLLLVAGGTDYFAVNYAGVSDWCISPAYGFLIPTYAALWVAGRHYATRHQDSLQSLALFSGIAFGAVSIAFIISNYSFYLFSGYYADMGFAHYSVSIVQDFVPYLTSALVYLIPAVLLYALVAQRAGKITHA